MTIQPDETTLREVPKRPFGVYMLVVILLLGIVAATLEIIRVRTELVGIWFETDKFLSDLSGLVSVTGRLVINPVLLTIFNGLIILVWSFIIIGLWSMQRWAWLLLMIITGIALTYSLFRYFEGNPNYTSMLMNMAVAFYLNDYNVQRAYARRVPGGGTE